jgi:uncharacterized membrane protein
MARAQATVALEPAEAMALWTNLERWPTFVEGFGRALEVSADWPAKGASLVWESIPGGRGRVTERVVEAAAGRFSTRVFEERLYGVQTATFVRSPERPGSSVELRLDYELARYGPLRALADLLFIRRALREALRRTLRRFAVEVEEEASLR